MQQEEQPNRRRNLSPVDISAITKSIMEATAAANHAEHCRFLSISPEEMAECVKFFRNWNEIMESSKKTIRNTLLVLGVTGLFGLMGLGFWMKKGG